MGGREEEKEGGRQGGREAGREGRTEGYVYVYSLSFSFPVMVGISGDGVRHEAPDTIPADWPGGPKRLQEVGDVVSG